MDMEVRAYLNFGGKARGLSGAKLKERTNLVLDETGLRPMYRKVIRELSKGYKQRTALAQALIHDPEVIILDEPTSGLDPHQIVEIRQLIRNLAEGRTVLLSTHILQEVEATADPHGIIHNGRILCHRPLKESRARATHPPRAPTTTPNTSALKPPPGAVTSGPVIPEPKSASHVSPPSAAAAPRMISRFAKFSLLCPAGPPAARPPSM